MKLVIDSDKPIFVLSGINLFEAGPISIFYDCLDSILKRGFDKKYCVVAFVHKIELFSKYKNSLIKFYELPLSRKSYLIRLYYEYIFFRKFSIANKIYIWLSLHDITPNVKAKKIYTYCHNSLPFYKPNLLDLKLSYKIFLFSLFYRYLYRINIKKNTSVIVQSGWMRKKFEELFGINNITVARPVIENNERNFPPVNFEHNLINSNKITFFYPAFPRVFKGHEFLCKAVEILERKYNKNNFEVILTVNGTENAYSEYIYESFKNLKTVNFMGLLGRDEVYEIYQRCSALIFPSQLETWGLPITEFKPTKKPVFLVDLPYAHETLGNYDNVCFFSPSSENDLAEKMNNFLEKKNVLSTHKAEIIEQPFAENWEKLLELICSP